MVFNQNYNAKIDKKISSVSYWSGERKQIF